MLITGNQVLEPSNNGILVIGGKDITVSHNNIVRSANAGVQQWHSLDSRIIGNSLFDCNRLSFNGVGNLADAYGQIVIDGNSNISTTTGSHMAVVQHNSMVKSNQGRAGAVYGINVQSGAYPTAKNKIVHDGNRSDAAVHFNNPNSIPTVNTHEAGVSTAELGHLSGVTSPIQTQVNAKQATLSAAQLIVANKTFSTVSTDGAALCTATEIKSYADTKQGTLSAAQLTVANKTFSTVATDGAALCTATEIKSYVDANAGGSSGQVGVVHFSHMTSWVQLADNVEYVHWSKSTQNNQGGGNGRFILPAFASDPPTTYTLWIMSHNPVSETGAEIILSHVSGGQDFHNASDDQEHLEFNGNYCQLKKPGRNTYACTYYHSTEKWHIRRVSSNVTPTQISQITSNTRYFQHFPHDESGYTSSSGNIFPVPSGYHEALLVYGDGSNFGWGTGGGDTGLGVEISLPVTGLIDGQKVILHSTMHRQTSSANQCLVMNFPGDISGTPNTRRVSALGVEYLGNASGGSRVVCPASNNHTRNHTYIFCAASDVWILRVDTN